MSLIKDVMQAAKGRIDTVNAVQPRLDNDLARLMTHVGFTYSILDNLILCRCNICKSGFDRPIGVSSAWIDQPLSFGDAHWMDIKIRDHVCNLLEWKIVEEGWFRAVDAADVYDIKLREDISQYGNHREIFVIHDLTKNSCIVRSAGYIHDLGASWDNYKRVDALSDLIVYCEIELRQTKTKDA